MGNLVDLKVERPTLPIANNRDVAGVVEIKSQVDYDFAAQMLRNVKDAWAQIEAKRKKIKAPIDEAAKEVQALFKPILDDLAKAEEILKAKLRNYEAEQERIALQKQNEIDEAAAREKAALEAKAIEYLEGGDVDKAAIAAESAELVVAPKVLPAFERPSGLSSRKVWKARIVDEDKFLAAVVGDKALRVGIDYDLTALAKLGAATNGKYDAPGVEFYQESQLASRAA